MKANVCIIGAGIIGITTALELQRRGVEVLLIDRDEPGMQTSFGNAGVLSVSGVLNVNNPSFLSGLPGMLIGRTPYVSYDFWHSVSQLSWVIQFMRYGTSRYTKPIAKALEALQSLSINRHRELIIQAGTESIFRERGWLKVYREAKCFRAGTLERNLMDSLDIEYECLSADDLRDLEPGLNPIYESGLLMSQTCSVTDPHALSSSYMDLFTNRGGAFRMFDVAAIHEMDGKGWALSSKESGRIECGQAVVACGPWSPDICNMIGYKVPMAWERGYHLNAQSPQPELRRPICDVQCGFVMAPQAATTRITSGVEFVHRDSQPNYRQIMRAFEDAKSATPLGESVDVRPWMGSRPTLPDGLPMIGRAHRHMDLWFNFGHQHIGMGTSAGSAVILADLMLSEDKANIAKQAYSPERFGA